MNVAQCMPWALYYSDMETWLPDRPNADSCGDRIFVTFHDRRDAFWRWHLHEQMTVIGHDDEAKHEEGMNGLGSIQRFDCLSGIRFFLKIWETFFRVDGNQHHVFVLYRMALGHTHSMIHDVAKIDW